MSFSLSVWFECFPVVEHWESAGVDSSCIQGDGVWIFVEDARSKFATLLTICANRQVDYAFKAHFLECYQASCKYLSSLFKLQEFRIKCLKHEFRWNQFLFSSNCKQAQLESPQDILQQEIAKMLIVGALIREKYLHSLVSRDKPTESWEINLIQRGFQEEVGRLQYVQDISDGMLNNITAIYGCIFKIEIFQLEIYKMQKGFPIKNGLDADEKTASAICRINHTICESALVKVAQMEKQFSTMQRGLHTLISMAQCLYRLQYFLLEGNILIHEGNIECASLHYKRVLDDELHELRLNFQPMQAKFSCIYDTIYDSCLRIQGYALEKYAQHKDCESQNPVHLSDTEKLIKIDPMQESALPIPTIVHYSPPAIVRRHRFTLKSGGELADITSTHLVSKFKIGQDRAIPNESNLSGSKSEMSLLSKLRNTQSKIATDNCSKQTAIAKRLRGNNSVSYTLIHTCSLCKVSFPKRNLPGKVMMHKVLHLQAKWGMRFSSRRYTTPSTLYATVLVCGLCYHMLSVTSEENCQDYNSNHSDAIGTMIQQSIQENYQDAIDQNAYRFENVAITAHAQQSSTKGMQSASLAINNETTGCSNSCSQTRVEDNPWLQVDLACDEQITSIEVWMSTEEQPLCPYWIFIGTKHFGNMDFLQVQQHAMYCKKISTFGRPIRVMLNPTIVAKSVRLQIEGFTSLCLSQIKIFRHKLSQRAKISKQQRPSTAQPRERRRSSLNSKLDATHMRIKSRANASIYSPTFSSQSRTKLTTKFRLEQINDPNCKMKKTFSMRPASAINRMKI